MNVVKQETNSGPNTIDPHGAVPPRREERAQVAAPPVDVFEGEEGFLVVVDLPGVAQGDLSIRLEKGEILIQGKRADATARCPALEYRRVLTLPPDVDGDAVGAIFNRGVLELRLPRKSSAKPRQIPVRSA